MKRKDVIVGLIILVILITAVLLIKRSIAKRALLAPSPTPSISQKIETNFPGLTIPADVDRTELTDVSGGDGFGIFTDTEVLANLPDLEPGYFYQVWSNENGKLVSLGKMRVAKGGYIFEGDLKNKKIVVSREKVFDNQVEVKILE